MEIKRHAYVYNHPICYLLFIYWALNGHKIFPNFVLEGHGPLYSMADADLWNHRLSYFTWARHQPDNGMNRSAVDVPDRMLSLSTLLFYLPQMRI